MLTETINKGKQQNSYTEANFISVVFFLDRNYNKQERCLKLAVPCLACIKP